MTLSMIDPNILGRMKVELAAIAVQFALIKLELAFDRALRAEAAAHPTTHYVWRSRGDVKVRTTHAANNGKVFAWDNPPPTGNPGEDYGCRCTAEPYVRGVSEYVYQTMISGMHDNPDKWGTAAFVRHFYFGEGVSVGLGETGNFTGVVNYYFYTLGKYNDVNAQIVDEARKYPSGSFEYEFDKSYDFRPYVFSLGFAKVRGLFRGVVQHQDEMMSISGTVEYQFDDTFTDPGDRREEAIGTSNPAAATPELLEDTEFGGALYDIIGIWLTSFRAEAKKDGQASRYQ